MTPDEIRIVEALARCSFCPGTSQKRFVRQMEARAANSKAPLTDRQRAYLWSIAWSWRRQLPRDLVGLALQYSGRVGTRGRRFNEERHRKRIAEVTKVRFKFDESSAVSVDKLKAQGLRFTELQVGDRTLLIPDERQGALFV